MTIDRWGETRTGPLAGLQVLDFTTNISGPYATRILADQGASVIKIERSEGDDSRLMSPTRDGVSAAFIALNRGKRSVVLNLKDPAHARIALELAAEADVLVENMRPGKMANIGLGFDDVKRVRPNIIYCSISGFGQTGPLSPRAAYDLIIQGRTGIMSITGTEDGDSVRVGPSIVDLSSGMWAAIAVTSALWRRDELAEAQWVDMSLFESGLGWMTLPIAQYEMSGELPRRLGAQTSLSAPADVYPTTDGHVVLAVLNDTIWRRMTAIPGLEAVGANPDFATNNLRVQHRELLTAQLRAAFATRDTEQWLRLLAEQGVPSDRIGTVIDALADEQAQARQMIQPVVCGDITLRSVGVPIRNHVYPKEQDPILGRAPGLGEHTDDIVRSFSERESQ